MGFPLPKQVLIFVADVRLALGVTNVGVTFERVYRFKEKPSPGVEDFPSAYFPFEGGFLMVAETDEAGREPWVTDGTTAGTRLLKDCKEGWQSFFADGGIVDSVTSQKHNFVQLGDEVYFTGRGVVRGESGLWRTDGSTEGTVLVDPDLRAEHMLAVKDKLYLLGQQWDPYLVNNWTMTIVEETDGNISTSERAAPLVDFNEGVRQGLVFLPNTSRLVTLEDERKRVVAYDTITDKFEVVFEVGGAWRTRRTSWAVLKNEATDMDAIIIMSGYEYIPGVVDRGIILRTDGTQEGTRLLSANLTVPFRVSPNPVKKNIVLITEDGGKSSDNNTCLGNLYRTDGNSLDLITSIALDPAPTNRTLDCPPAAFVPWAARDERQLLVYTSNENGMKFYVTNGTASGTELLFHLYPGQPVEPKYGIGTGDSGFLLIVAPKVGEPADVWLLDFSRAAGASGLAAQKAGTLPVGISRIVGHSPSFDNSILLGARFNDTSIELWRVNLPPRVETASPTGENTTSAPTQARLSPTEAMQATLSPTQEETTSTPSPTQDEDSTPPTIVPVAGPTSPSEPSETPDGRIANIDSSAFYDGSSAIPNFFATFFVLPVLLVATTGTIW